MPGMLMWAYGSNLNIFQMRQRCPTANPVGPLTVPNAILRFRGVADVAYYKGAECPGGLWEITEEDEQVLDRYEGVTGGLYSKRYFVVDLQQQQAVGPRRVLYYQMNQAGIMPPSQYYLDIIVQGYRDFGLSTERLERAFQHSIWRQRKTPALRARHRRRGMTFATHLNPAAAPLQSSSRHPSSQVDLDGDDLGAPLLQAKANGHATRAPRADRWRDPESLYVYEITYGRLANRGWYWSSSISDPLSYGPYGSAGQARQAGLRGKRP